MSIEEAEYILNEAVIQHPSISSYTYISAEDINEAIHKILEEKIENEKKIKELKENIIQEKNKLEKIIKEKEIEKIKYPSQTHINKKNRYKKIFIYAKKLLNPLFWLEN